MSKQNLTALVDELGAVKAEVAELTKRERELKKEVAKRCSRQLIAAHRTVKQRVEVRVHARVRDAA
jgi:hypothetical protein